MLEVKVGMWWETFWAKLRQELWKAGIEMHFEKRWRSLYVWRQQNRFSYLHICLLHLFQYWYKCTLFSVVQAIFGGLIFYLLQAKCKYRGTKIYHFSELHRSTSAQGWCILKMARTPKKLYKYFAGWNQPMNHKL